MSEIRINADAPAEPEAREDQKEGLSGEVLTPTDKPADKSAEPKKKFAGKYDTIEELEKGYLEAQKAIGGKKPEAPKTEVAEKAVEDAGLDLATLNAELAENDGKFTQKTLNALKAKGISPDLASAFVEGQKARTAQMQTTLAETAGSEENLKAVLTWAVTGASKQLVSMYNAAVDSGNVEGAAALLQSLQARHTEAVGTDPEFVGGGTSSNAAETRGYASNAEMIRDINNPLYESDPAFRKKVERRLLNTK